MEASLRLLQLIEPNDLSDPDFLRYQAFLRRTYGERARRLGWMPRADDDVEARAIRSRLLPLVAGRGEDPALVEEARSLAGRWLADHRTVPSETAWGALNAAAIRGDRALFDLVAAEASRTADRADKERYHAALGLFEEPALTRAALELAVDDRSDLRDTMVILNVALSRRATRAQAGSRNGGRTSRRACAPTRGPGSSSRPPSPASWRGVAPRLDPPSTGHRLTFR